MRRACGLFAVAMLVACHESMVPNQAPDAAADAAVDRDASAEGGVSERPSFCARSDDDVTALFCGTDPSSITSLEELKEQLGLERVVLLGHSTGLNGRLVSAINPRAVMLQNGGIADGFVAATFTRGAQRVELISLDHDSERLNFYLLEVTQACNDAPRGCTPGDLFTPAIEKDWLAVHIRDDEELKNEPQDCRRCHGGAPSDDGNATLLMRELESPWLHWFDSQLSTLQDDYKAAKQSEPYADERVLLDSPFLLQNQIGNAQRELELPPQPLLFQSGVIGIETMEFDVLPPRRGPGADDPDLAASPTWRLLYDAHRAGLALAPPYHHERITDPSKLAAATSAYRAFLAGELEQDELPDISDVLPDDPRVLAEMSFAIEPDASDDELLVRACGDCHNVSLDPTLSRARFDIDLSTMTRAALDRAIERLALAEDATGAMPPRELQRLSSTQRSKLIDYLERVDPSTASPRPMQPLSSSYTLELAHHFEGELPYNELLIGDVTGDGAADLMSSPLIFEQGPSGELAEPLPMAESLLSAKALVDLNDDGQLDVIAHGPKLDGVSDDALGLAVFLSNGDGTFGPAIDCEGPTVLDLRADLFADVDQDGRLDLVTRARPPWARVVAYLSIGVSGCTAVDVELTDAADARFAALALGDMTGDGVVDLALLDTSVSYVVAIYAHDGVDRFETNAKWHEVTTTRSLLLDDYLAIGDANDDGRNDIVSSPGLRLSLQDEHGELSAAPQIGASDGPFVFADMNGDGRDDLVSLLAARGEVQVLLQDDLGLARAPALVFDLPNTPGSVLPMLAVGDLSSDGCPDVAVARNGSVIVFHGTRCTPQSALP